MNWITKCTTLFVCTVMLVCGQSHATLIAYEGFDYDAGSLDGQNGGSGWDGAWGSGDWTVSATGLSYTDSQGTSLVTSGGSVTTTANDSNWVHFRDLSSVSQSLMDEDSVFWMSFLIESRSENPRGTYGISLFAGGSEPILLGRHFQQGSPTGSTLASTGWNSEVSTVQDEGESETWLFVAQFDMTENEANFWINPDIGGPVPENALASGSQTISDWNTTRIRLGQFGSSDGSNFSLDEIRFGTDFASVTPIPEPGTLVLVGITLGAFLIFRKRRG
jgi:hypothetical protein